MVGKKRSSNCGGGEGGGEEEGGVLIPKEFPLNQSLDGTRGGKPDMGLLTAKLQDKLVQETRTGSPAQIWLLLGGAAISFVKHSGTHDMRKSAANFLQ